MKSGGTEVQSSEDTKPTSKSGVSDTPVLVHSNTSSSATTPSVPPPAVLTSKVVELATPGAAPSAEMIQRTPPELTQPPVENKRIDQPSIPYSGAPLLVENDFEPTAPDEIELTAGHFVQPSDVFRDGDCLRTSGLIPTAAGLPTGGVALHSSALRSESQLSSSIAHRAAAEQARRLPARSEAEGEMSVEGSRGGDTTLANASNDAVGWSLQGSPRTQPVTPRLVADVRGPGAPISHPHLPPKAQLRPLEPSPPGLLRTGPSAPALVAGAPPLASSNAGIPALANDTQASSPSPTPAGLLNPTVSAAIILPPPLSGSDYPPSLNTSSASSTASSTPLRPPPILLPAHVPPVAMSGELELDSRVALPQHLSVTTSTAPPSSAPPTSSFYILSDPQQRLSRQPVVSSSLFELPSPVQTEGSTGLSLNSDKVVFPTTQSFAEPPKAPRLLSALPPTVSDELALSSKLLASSTASQTTPHAPNIDPTLPPTVSQEFDLASQQATSSIITSPTSYSIPDAPRLMPIPVVSLQLDDGR
ncbi:hypothetical protein HDU93_009438 [Gonapodya sp. JEL0774]|nr:hypothetical protein HDU93_009438 [Gonapodya sp. JEL0774]